MKVFQGIISLSPSVPALWVALLFGMISSVVAIHMTAQLKATYKNTWLDHRKFNQTTLPANIRSWLLDEGSLTERLKKVSHNQFQVQVLYQGFLRPQLNEQREIKLKSANIALVRETVLLCAGEPWVFARSIIPVTTLSGRLRHLKKLSNQSLGALLFCDPYMHRSPFQLALINPNQLPSYLALDLQKPLWGRRSCFSLKNKPLLVSEIFLPSFRPTSDD